MRKKLIIGIVALLVLGAIGYAFYHHHHSAAPKVSMPPAKVKVVAVIRVHIIPSVKAVGDLSATSAKLSSQMAGQVADVLYTAGAFVNKGAKLIQLDDSMCRSQWQAAQANLNLQLINFKRHESLVKKEMEAPSVLDQARATLSDAKAKVAIEQAKLDHMAIKAPIDGIASSAEVSVGEYVSVGQHLLDIVDSRTLTVKFRLPERYRTQVKLEQTVIVTSASQPSKTYRARVNYIAATIEVSSRTVLIKAKLDNAKGELAPGGFVNVVASVGSSQNSLSIPEQAVQSGIEGSYVFVYHDGKVKKTIVHIVKHDRARIIIDKGLAEGDKIVIEGLQQLSDDMKVETIK